MKKICATLILGLLCLSCVITKENYEPIKKTQGVAERSYVLKFYVEESDYKHCGLIGWNLDSLKVITNTGSFTPPLTKKDKYICLLETDMSWYLTDVQLIVTDGEMDKLFIFNDLPTAVDTVTIFGYINQPILFDPVVSDWEDYIVEVD